VSWAGDRARRIVIGRREELRSWVRRSTQVVIVAAVVGGVTGLAVAGFERVVVEGVLDALGRAPLWIIALAPFTGLVIAALALRTVGGGITPDTGDEYLRAFHDRRHNLGWRSLVGRITASVATLGLGGAMGLEGPSLYLGATFGAQTQPRLRRVFLRADRRVLLVAAHVRELPVFEPGDQRVERDP